MSGLLVRLSQRAAAERLRPLARQRESVEIQRRIAERQLFVRGAIQIRAEERVRSFDRLIAIGDFDFRLFGFLKGAAATLAYLRVHVCIE